MEGELDLTGHHLTSRRGRRLRGACPIHAPERSLLRCFSVELTKGLFRFFKCGAQGNQFGLRAPLRKAALDLGEHPDVRIPASHSDFTAR